MTATHWAADENRLVMPTPTMDAEIRVYHRNTRRADNQRDRAYRAGRARRPWDKGDPGRRGKPWPAFAREFYDWGLEEAELVVRERRADQARQIAEKGLRAEARAQAKRRKARAEQAWKVSRAVLGRKRTRKLQRWSKRLTHIRATHSRRTVTENP